MYSIDKVLADANASPKSRTIFRAIYAVAIAMTKMYFIIALEAILREHDKHPEKGTKMMTTGTHIHTLGYADDTVLIDESPLTAELRVNVISKGSKSEDPFPL